VSTGRYRRAAIKVTSRFRQLIQAPEIVQLPVAHDALCARLIQRAGFQALACGGYAATASLLGAPDTSQLSLTEMVDFYSRIVDSVTIPVFVDGDTGFGNTTNVARTVRLFEKAGVAGYFLEDQVYPKRCGHMAGKAVIPALEMAEKLKAALDTRRDPDLVIMARTDALAVNGIDDALERAALYRETGADLLFVEAPTNVMEMTRICQSLDGPCLANNLETGMTPFLSASELQAIGYAAVAYPVTASYTMAKALMEVFEVLARKGTTETHWDRMVDFETFGELVGLPEQRRREAAYQDAARELGAGRRGR